MITAGIYLAAKMTMDFNPDNDPRLAIPLAAGGVLMGKRVYNKTYDADNYYTCPKCGEKN
jgi:hypothetical protein